MSIWYIFACGKHICYFCPATELQWAAVAATEPSITQHLEQQYACFTRLLLQQLNGALDQLCRTTAELPVLFFIVIWVSDQRTTTPSGTRGYFPITKELHRNSGFRRGFFSTDVCFQCRLCGCFPSTSRQRGIPTWVALKLQSIMCDRESVTTMQGWQYTHIHNHVHWITDAYTHTYIFRYVHVHLRSESLDLDRQHTWNKAWWEKNCCQVQRLQNTSSHL